MNKELCLHMLKQTKSAFFLQCDCGSFSQHLCVVCKTAVSSENTSTSYKCSGCSANICNRCVFDCGRVNDAAQCDACATSNGFRFDAKYWCVTVRLFIVNTQNVLKVDNHILQTLFNSTNKAISAIPQFLAKYYVDMPLMAVLIEQLTLPTIDETIRREVCFSTSNVFYRSEHVRMEVHLKSMLINCASFLPKQMLTENEVAK